MKTEATTPVNVPDGTYEAVWSGYNVWFSTSDGGRHVFKTKTGIRGTSTVDIHVEGGSVEIVPRKHEPRG